MSPLRVTGVELLRLSVPFKRVFTHATAERRATDTVMLLLADEEGREGLGEAQARPYVTGESPQEILAVAGPAMARRVMEASWRSQAELRSWVDEELVPCGRNLALLGAFEAALRQLWARREPLDEAAWIGPPRRSPPTRCLTVGLEDDPGELRHHATAARLQGAGVVKVKVGSPGDRGRLERLNGYLRGRVPLRLDANGELTLEAAVELLEGCRHLPLHSLEQPFAADDPRLDDKLRRLHEITGVPLMADESVCTYAEARRITEAGTYQMLNLRVGKMGGLRGVMRIAELARGAGLGLVAGTMVGESGVLDHASERLLAHCEDLSYVEGLGQSRFLLESDPVETVGEGPDPIVRLRLDLPEGWLGERVVVAG